MKKFKQFFRPLNSLPAPKTPHAVPPGYERVKDSSGANVLRKIKK